MLPRELYAYLPRYIYVYFNLLYMFEHIYHLPN